MALTAQNLIDRVEKQLNDEGNDRWTATGLLEYLNDARREIVYLKPGASPTVANIKMISGTRQTIPAGSGALIDLPRNMGTDGTTPGSAITNYPRRVFDVLYPGWHAATASTTIEHFFFDQNSPKTFYIYPPSDGTNYAEAHYSVIPADIAAGAVIGLGDEYANAMMDFMLYRAHSLDADFAANAARADADLARFQSSLGLISAGGSSVDPSIA